MVTRRAIVIGCPGEQEDYLPGVGEDLQNVFDFLCSPLGGSFYPEEVVCLENPTWQMASDYLTVNEADYQLIYFSGHGGTDLSDRLICFSDRKVPDKWLLNRSIRQLIVIDGCRNYLPVISGIREEIARFSDFDGGYLARRLMDDVVERSLPGKIIVHGTHEGSYATDTAEGGAFTISLLQAALAHQLYGDFRYYRIQDLLMPTQTWLKQQGYKQIPEVVYHEGLLAVPFLMDVFPINDLHLREFQPIRNRKTLLFKSALTVLAVAGISEIFKSR